MASLSALGDHDVKEYVALKIGKANICFLDVLFLRSIKDI